MMNPFKNKKGLEEVFDFIRDVGGLEKNDYKNLFLIYLIFQNYLEYHSNQ